MHRNILTFLIFFAETLSFAANVSADSLATVMGTVSRRFGETTLYLEGASVRLYSECDTLSRRTDYFGGFSFTGIKPGTVRIAVTYIGCEPVSGSYDITGGTNMVYFQLEKAADTLRTAVVTAERNLFKRSGDTLKVDTRALSTLPDAYAMDLLKQVPGIEISNGKVMAFGKKVERTYVNGVQIFGDGTLTAFRNIRADEVKGIDIYDESSAISDYRGEKAAEKETVLDIKTKDPIVSAVRAAAVATGGADETPDEAGKVRMRYDLEAKADFFSEMLLLGARGGADNLEREVMQYGSPVAGGGCASSHL